MALEGLIWEIKDRDILDKQSVIIFGLFDCVDFVVKFVLHLSVDQEERNRQDNDYEIENIEPQYEIMALTIVLVETRCGGKKGLLAIILTPAVLSGNIAAAHIKDVGDQCSKYQIHNQHLDERKKQ